MHHSQIHSHQKLKATHNTAPFNPLKHQIQHHLTSHFSKDKHFLSVYFPPCRVPHSFHLKGTGPVSQHAFSPLNYNKFKNLAKP